MQKEVSELKRKLAAALARAERPTPTKHATPTSAAGAAGTPRSTPRAAPDLSSLGSPPTMPPPPTPPPTPPVALAGAPPPPVLAGARPVEVWVDEAGAAAEAPPSTTKKRKGSRSSKRSSPGATGGGFGGDDTADENERTIAAAVADATAALLPLRDRNSVMPPTPSPRKTTPRKQNSFDTLADTLVSIAATPPPAAASAGLSSSSSLSAVKEVRVLRSAARGTPGNRPVTAPASSSKGLSAKPRRVAQPTPKATPKAPPGRVTRQTPGASRTPASSRKAGRLEQPRWN